LSDPLKAGKYVVTHEFNDALIDRVRGRELCGRVRHLMRPPAASCFVTAVYRDRGGRLRCLRRISHGVVARVDTTQVNRAIRSVLRSRRTERRCAGSRV